MLHAYENVKGQIGGCGIWCGSCALGNGSLLALTDCLRDTLDGHGFEHWAPDGMDYPDFVRGLAAVRGVASCTGCRKGGGRDDCALRVCSEAKGLTSCADCTDLRACSHQELLDQMRAGARAAGLRVLDPSDDIERTLSDWQAWLPTSRPAALIFGEGGGEESPS